jgi:hypothetical protein
MPSRSQKPYSLTHGRPSSARWVGECEENAQSGRERNGAGSGLNPYAYVGSNPLTNIDPLGLYQSDVHYYLTFFLAMTAGIDYVAARTIALAAQFIDDNPNTQPVDETSTATVVLSATKNQDALKKYHFVLPGPTDGDVTRHSSTQLDALLGYAQNASTKCAQFQFLGEYLHTFEDTFSHRDYQNVPYSATRAIFFMQAGIGHGEHGSNPDYTFNHEGKDEFAVIAGAIYPSFVRRQWNVNEDRTVKMEEEVFNLLLQYGNPAKVKTWDEVKAILHCPESIQKCFNQIQEIELHPHIVGRTPDDFPKKIALLQDALKTWGYTTADGSEIDLGRGGNSGYNADAAMKARENDLKDAQGNPLKQEDYSGAILKAEPAK